MHLPWALLPLCLLAAAATPENSVPDAPPPTLVPSSTESPASAAPSAETEGANTEPTAEPTTTSPADATTTTTSTTSKPTTTTQKPTTSKPAPEPKFGTWNVTQGDVVCVLAQMSVKMNLSYFDATHSKRSQAFEVPWNANATGNCGEGEQNLTLTWRGPAGGSDNLTLHFKKDSEKKRYSLHHLEAAISSADLPNSNLSQPAVWRHVSPAFAAGLQESYRCAKPQALPLVSSLLNGTAGEFVVSNLQFQAFRATNSTAFGLAKDCAFSTPDVVPIAVGCALAALVVIVLIAYLVGRRRSQARGYLSM